MTAGVVPKDVQIHRIIFLEKCDACTRKRLPMRKKMPPAVPGHRWTNAIALPGWTRRGSVVLSRKQIPNICGVVSCDRRAQGRYGAGQCS